MPSILSRAKTFLFDLPGRGKLAYCLLRDERIPAAPKAALFAALALIVSPLDFPAWIPVLGDFEVPVLVILALDTFIEAAPDEIRREHQAALKARTSVWDRDYRDTVAALRHELGVLVGRVRSRVRHRDEFESISEVV